MFSVHPFFLPFQNHTEFFLVSKTEPPMNMALISKVESLIRMIDAFKTARYDQHVGHEARFVLQELVSCNTHCV